jgi:AcrR family transcriptional regulator
MNRPVRTRTDPDEVRILEVAKEHFRRIGYHKTSVADIASELAKALRFSQAPIALLLYRG